MYIRSLDFRQIIHFKNFQIHKILWHKIGKLVKLVEYLADAEMFSPSVLRTSRRIIL